MKSRSIRKTLGEQAYESLHDAIINLRLEPGKMIYEAELAIEMGISRTPVREAFRMLLSDELIDVLPQKGARVELISERKVEEARLVREILEVSGFRLLARNWNNNEEHYKNVSKQVEELLENQRKAARQNDPLQFLKWDEVFHRKLLTQMGNLTLLTIVFQMHGHLNRLRYLMLQESSHMDGLVKEHEDLFAAVVANNEPATIKLVECHLRKLNEELPAIKALFPNFFKP